VAQAGQKPVKQAEVHGAHQVGVFLRQDVERAVAEDDPAAFGAGFEAVLLESTQDGVLVGRFAVGCTGGLAELGAQPMCASVESRPG